MNTQKLISLCLIIGVLISAIHGFPSDSSSTDEASSDNRKGAGRDYTGASYPGYLYPSYPNMPTYPYPYPSENGYNSFPFYVPARLGGETGPGNSATSCAYAYPNRRYACYGLGRR